MLDGDLLLRAVGYTGLLGLVGEAVRWSARKLYTRRARRTGRETILRAQIQVELHSIISRTTAVRAAVIMSHNGGGDPSRSTVVNSTVLDEATEDKPWNWANQALDAECKIMLGNVIEHGVVHLVRSKMRAGILRTKMEADGVGRSKLYLLAVKPHGVLYLSVDFGGEESPQAYELERIRVVVSRLVVHYRESSDAPVDDPGVENGPPRLRRTSGFPGKSLLSLLRRR